MKPLSKTVSRPTPRGLFLGPGSAALRVALLGLAFSLPAQAAVVGTGTPGSCTAVALNTAVAAGGTVTFDCGVAPATIDMGSVNLFVAANNPAVVIDGGGSITLDGTGGTHPVVVVNANGSGLPDVTFRRITIANGNAATLAGYQDGGAIYNFGKLTLDTVTFSGNKAMGSGGAISQKQCPSCAAPSIDVRYSNFNGNVSNGANQGGGAICLEAGSLNVLETGFSGNTAPTGYGGAIYLWPRVSGAPPTASIGNGHFSNNSAVSGGAIWLIDLGIATPVTVDSSTFATNVTTGSSPDGPGGAIGMHQSRLSVTGTLFQQNQSQAAWAGALWASSSTVLVQDSTFKQNASASGGAGAFGMTASTVTVQRSTFSANTANGSNFGGAIAANGTVGIENSTISGNSAAGASGAGGAMYVQAGTTDLRSVTVTANSANSRGGIYVASSGALTMRNSVLAGNTETGAGTVNAEIYAALAGGFTSNGYNLLGNSAGISTGTGDVVNASPNLGPLANNGGPSFGNVVVVGPTFTHLPNAGSPALDAGDPVGCLALGGSALATDQRNATRPSPAGGRCDIGAVEVQVVGPSAKLAFSQQPADTVAGAAIAPSVTVQLQDAGGAAVAQAGVSVTLALGSGTGTLSGTATQTTNASGLATFAGLSVNLAGTKRLSAASGVLTGATSNTFVISAGAAASLVITGGNGQSAAVGTAFGVPLQVLVTDTQGNPVSGAQVTFTAPGSGASAALATSPATTDAAGHAQVTATANATTGAYAVTAASGTLTTVAFDLTNAAASATANDVPALGTMGLVLLALALSVAGAWLLGRGSA